jgi:anaerobic selenocysteine-containing dehydrogenase
MALPRQFNPQALGNVTPRYSWQIDPSKLNITGREVMQKLADTRPTGIRIGIGLQRHGGGGMAVRTLSCIPGVTGDWRYPGGGVFYDTRGFFGMNWNALWRDDLRTRPPRVLSMSRLGEGLLEIDNPPVKVLFVYGSNPAASVPDQTTVRRGLAREDLFPVVVEHFPTDTAKFADIVLPRRCSSSMPTCSSRTDTVRVVNEPAVASPGNA